jgi:tRNA threonylcarbamoyladenosine biosynthesis protein TsaE
MILELNSPSPDKTFNIGERIGNCLRGNEIILLCGNLGAGKTLMTKGIAASLGIDPDEIVSPTFTLLNQVEFVRELPGKEMRPIVSRFIHFDCYRLADPGGGRDELQVSSHSGYSGPGLIVPEIDEWIDLAVLVVEWAQYLHPSYFNLGNSISVHFNIGSDGQRCIRIESKLTYFRL